MEKKSIKYVLLAYVLILLMALVKDSQAGVLSENGDIERTLFGEEEKEIDFSIHVEEEDKTYDYTLSVPTIPVTKEEAEDYLEAATLEINTTCQVVDDYLQLKEEYQKGRVSATWSFNPRGIISYDGKIHSASLTDEVTIVTAEVLLACGEYEKVYQFPIELSKENISSNQKMQDALSLWEKELEESSSQTIQLPPVLADKKVRWTQKKEDVTLKILCLELISGVLIWVANKKKSAYEKTKLHEQMESTYTEIVSQLALLVGSGMTCRHAWNRIATQNFNKRQKGATIQNQAYAVIERMNRRMLEGESERSAYQKMANETKLVCYHRLARLLISNLEKGSTHLSASLEQEAAQAYQMRVTRAKKLGEEASTRMLFPIMLMLMVVMAIIMVPAIIGFMG